MDSGLALRLCLEKQLSEKSPKVREETGLKIGIFYLGQGECMVIIWTLLFASVVVYQWITFLKLFFHLLFFIIHIPMVFLFELFRNILVDWLFGLMLNTSNYFGLFRQRIITILKLVDSLFLKKRPLHVNMLHYFDLQLALRACHIRLLRISFIVTQEYFLSERNYFGFLFW